MIQGIGTGAPAPVAKVPSMTLGEYLAETGKVLRTNLPKAWVEAVVLDAKPTRKGLSVELVEPMANERQNGFLRGMIWSRTAVAIEDAVGVPLDAARLKAATSACSSRPAFIRVFTSRARSSTSIRRWRRG